MLIGSPEIWRRIIQQQHEEWLEVAERDRLVREIRLSRQPRGLYCGLMCWLGRRLIALGDSLLAEFGERPSEPSLRRRTNTA